MQVYTVCIYVRMIYIATYSIDLIAWPINLIYVYRNTYVQDYYKRIINTGHD